MLRPALLGLLVLANVGASRAQLLTGGSALYAEVGLLAEVAESSSTTLCAPCAALFPTTRFGLVSHRWDVGAAIVGPTLGEAHPTLEAPSITRPTLLALDGRYRMGPASLGARVLYSFPADKLAGRLASAVVLAGVQPIPSLTLEAGAGPLSIERAGARETGWSALAGLHYASGSWSVWSEAQSTTTRSGHGWSALAQLAFRGFRPALLLNVLAHGQPALREEVAGPGGPPGGPPFVTSAPVDPSTGLATEQLGFVQVTLGAEWPLAGGLRLLTEAGARTGSDRSIHGVARAGIRLALGPWTTGPRPRSRWEIGASRAELAVAHEDDGRLFLVGDFNGWAEPGLPLRPDGSVHRVVLDLPPGTYAYKVALEDKHGRRWLPLPTELAAEPDGFGDRNGLLIITE